MKNRTTKEREQMALLATIISLVVLIAVWILVFMPAQKRYILKHDSQKRESAEKKVLEGVQAVAEKPIDVPTSADLINEISN